MDTVDRRVKRTQKTLIEALVSVSLEKGYDQVTIKDITDRADVAYSTFFRHYRDKDELLLKLLEQTIETLSELIQENTPAQASGRILFEHIQQQHRFYRVLFSSESTSHILQRIQNASANAIAQRYPAHTDAPDLIPVEIAANHMIASIFALIRWWLDHDMLYPVERMAFIYSELIIKPLELHLGKVSAPHFESR